MKYISSYAIMDIMQDLRRDTQFMAGVKRKQQEAFDKKSRFPLPPRLLLFLPPPPLLRTFIFCTHVPYLANRTTASARTHLYSYLLQMPSLINSVRFVTTYPLTSQRSIEEGNERPGGTAEVRSCFESVRIRASELLPRLPQPRLFHPSCVWLRGSLRALLLKLASR